MPDGLPSVVVDAVTLSNVALTDALPVLTKRYGPRLCTTAQVLDEILDGIACGYEALRRVMSAVSADELRVLSLTEEERVDYASLLHNLGSGEASCIACAATRRAVVASDDRAVRACCAERGVAVTGTIGILKACCCDGTLSADRAEAMLREMQAQGFYSPVRRLADIL